VVTTLYFLLPYKYRWMLLLDSILQIILYSDVGYVIPAKSKPNKSTVRKKLLNN
jgi:hypothetical protein